jgi:proteasome lid subunit RPN8/RPN11
VTERYPIRNDLASRTEYLTNARDLLDAVRAMRPAGIDVLAVYHSHPTSAPVPSRKDIDRNTWGETVVHVIIGLAGDIPEVRAWWLAETESREAAFEVV